MRVLITTDAFPPNCGGSGWSAYELVKGLRGREHEVVVVQPTFQGGSRFGSRRYHGVTIREFRTHVPDLPMVRAYLKSERLGSSLSRYLRELIERERIDLVHAQHVLTAPPSVKAARATRTPVVCTVRDYWPVCYWGDLRFDRTGDTRCPECSIAMMTKCVRPRSGRLWPLALSVIPYMRRNLASKQRALTQASGIVAVSQAMADDLRDRCSSLTGQRVEIIPNMVDAKSMNQAVEETAPPMDTPYAVFVGKLAPNKGSGLLPAVIDRADLPWPLVVVGDGPERSALEAATRDRKPTVQFTGWLPQESVWRWVAHADLLIFPSRGPESLSRVLLEAGALGAAIAAMNTGGTDDILTHERSALLSTEPEALANDVRRLVEDRSLRERLGGGAKRDVSERFGPVAVLDRIEALYRSVTTS